MSNSSRYIRLSGAVAAAVGSCTFVSLYSWASKTALFHETNGAALTVAADHLAKYAGYAFVIPALFLFTVIWATLRRDNESIVEILVTASWVFAFL